MRLHRRGVCLGGGGGGGTGNGNGSDVSGDAWTLAANTIPSCGSGSFSGNACVDGGWILLGGGCVTAVRAQRVTVAVVQVAMAAACLRRRPFG